MMEKYIGWKYFEEKKSYLAILDEIKLLDEKNVDTYFLIFQIINNYFFKKY